METMVNALRASKSEALQYKGGCNSQHRSWGLLNKFNKLMTTKMSLWPLVQQDLRVLGIVVKAILNKFLNIMGFVLLATLMACGEEKNKKAASQQPQFGESIADTVSFAEYQVSNLSAIPGDGSVILRWNNPNFIISSFNVSVYDATNNDRLVEEASNANVTLADGVEIGAGAMQVEHTINRGLENNHSYSFEVSARLVGDDPNRFSPSVRLNNRRNAALPQGNFSALPVTPAEARQDLVFIGPNQDGDEYADVGDSCPQTHGNLLQTNDADKDGCHDAEDAFPNDFTESSDYDGDLLGDNRDPDDDNDEVLDVNDLCPQGRINWISSLLWDYDGDGCHNFSEDEDDDNDRVLDLDDACIRDILGWISTPTSDHDRDGCRDIDEDNDDDGDTVADLDDSCPLSITLFISTPANDYDGDGCFDDSEDNDDDGDTIADEFDSCFRSPRGFISSSINDVDRDGCRDADEDTDIDNDGIDNAEDKDADGNGLIEISNADELNNIRLNLDKTSLIDEAGCINNSANGITCYGYELVADINLSGYGGYSSWVPIGACQSIDAQNNLPGNLPSCMQDKIFNVFFEGNGHTISNLNISQDHNEDLLGVGLFGAAGPSATLQNVNLHNVNITQASASRSFYLGAFVGVANGAKIISVSVLNANLIGYQEVGGLIGIMLNDAAVDDAHVEVANILANLQNAGGLVGQAIACNLKNSSAKIGTISSTQSGGVGGLIGSVENCELQHSYAIADTISAENNNVGGLLGTSKDSNISSSYAITNSLTTASNIAGGLIGSSSGNRISASFSQSNEINALSQLGSLVGLLSNNNIIEFSYSFSNSGSSDRNISLVNTAPSAHSVLTNSYSVAVYSNGLWSGSSAPTVQESYWDSSVVKIKDVVINAAENNARTTDKLQKITDFSGDYSMWGQGWCNPDTGEFTTNQNIAMQRGYATNPAWSLGATDQYPTLTCFKSLKVEQQLVRQREAFN